MVSFQPTFQYLQRKRMIVSSALVEAAKTIGCCSGYIANEYKCKRPPVVQSQIFSLSLQSL